VIFSGISMHMSLGLNSNRPTGELISGRGWIGVVCLAVLRPQRLNSKGIALKTIVIHPWFHPRKADLPENDCARWHLNVR